MYVRASEGKETCPNWTEGTEASERKPHDTGGSSDDDQEEWWRHEQSRVKKEEEGGKAHHAHETEDREQQIPILERLSEVVGLAVFHPLGAEIAHEQIEDGSCRGQVVVIDRPLQVRPGCVAALAARHTQNATNAPTQSAGSKRGNQEPDQGRQISVQGAR